VVFEHPRYFSQRDAGRLGLQRLERFGGNFLYMAEPVVLVFAKEILP